MAQNSQLQRLCLVCGGIADDTHHGRPHDLSQGKGSGGTSLDDHEHFEYLPLCRKDHDRVHAKEIIITLHEGVARTQTADGELLGERPMETIDGLANEIDVLNWELSRIRNLLPFLSDEAMAFMWERIDGMAAKGYAGQCALADAMRQRYGGYGAKWYQRAGEILGVSHQTVYERARAWRYLAAVDDPVSEIQRLGRNTIRELGSRVEKGEDVMALADEADALLTNGATRTAVAAAVKSGETRTLPCEDGSCRCRWCGREMA